MNSQDIGELVSQAYERCIDLGEIADKAHKGHLDEIPDAVDLAAKLVMAARELNRATLALLNQMERQEQQKRLQAVLAMKAQRDAAKEPG